MHGECDKVPLALETEERRGGLEKGYVVHREIDGGNGGLKKWTKREKQTMSA